MKSEETIFDIASKAYPGEGTKTGIFDYGWNAFIEGAFQQNKIDVKKVCEFLEKYIDDSINSGMTKKEFINRLSESIKVMK